MKNKTALITGAGSGIGLALAYEFARNGHSLFLTSRDETELSRIQAEINARHRVDVEFFAQDLERPGACESIHEFALARGLEIEILCNDAGLGRRGNFWTIPLEQHLSVVRVNVEALVKLTHLFLPEMLRRGHGAVLNVASVAAFEPGPLMAIYHASKAFVLSLTEALVIELENTGVTVTALCPGPTDTDFFPKADMVDVRGFQKTKVSTPEEVAAEAYKGLMRGDDVVVPGGSNKALVFARRFLTEHAQASLNKKLYEEVKPSERRRNPGDVRRARQKQMAGVQD